MRRGILLLAALCAFPARADDAPPPKIRPFDLATTQKLGRAMVEQDQEAWRATDILMAQHKQAELVAGHMHGWIVVKHDDGDVVRFIRTTADGPEAYYDVSFPKAHAPALSEPANRALDAEERAQYDARMLALSKTDLLCGDNLNTIVLKDPERPGWIVWVMQATQDPKLIVIGGHERFSVSPDGKTVVQADKLSAGCRNFPKTGGPHGERAQLVLEQIVSDLPVETYVFASLSYGVELRVGTLDGKAWRINAGLITPIDMDMPGVDGYAARQLMGFRELCVAIVPGPHGMEDAKLEKVDAVIAVTEDSPVYEPKPAPSARAAAILCGRQDLVPAPNDYKVLAAGYRLYLDDHGDGHPKRMAAFLMDKGRLVYRQIEQYVLPGELLARIQLRLEKMQEAMAKAP